jgi:hypothetical protein
VDDAEGPREARPRPRVDEERIERYAESCPDSWAGFSMDGDRTLVWFTDPDRHRAAVLALVDESDRFEVRSAPRSAAELAAVRAEVDELLDRHRDSWYGCGFALHRVSVSLAGHATELAEQLHTRFGDAVDVQVAGHSYPIDASARRRRLPYPVQTTIEIPGLEMVAELETPGARSGGIARGWVHLHNGSDETLSVAPSNGALGMIIDDAGPLGGSGFAQTLARMSVLLDPGGDARIPFAAGTDGLDPSLGPLVPPGDYRLVVRLDVIVARDRDPATINRTPPRHGDIITNPIPIRVLARPS